MRFAAYRHRRLSDFQVVSLLGTVGVVLVIVSLLLVVIFTVDVSGLSWGAGEFANRLILLHMVRTVLQFGVLVGLLVALDLWSASQIRSSPITWKITQIRAIGCTPG